MLGFSSKNTQGPFSCATAHTHKSSSFTTMSLLIHTMSDNALLSFHRVHTRKLLLMDNISPPHFHIHDEQHLTAISPYTCTQTVFPKVMMSRSNVIMYSHEPIEHPFAQYLYRLSVLYVCVIQVISSVSSIVYLSSYN